MPGAVGRPCCWTQDGAATAGGCARQSASGWDVAAVQETVVLAARCCGLLRATRVFCQGGYCPRCTCVCLSRVSPHRPRTWSCTSHTLGPCWFPGPHASPACPAPPCSSAQGGFECFLHSTQSVKHQQSGPSSCQNWGPLGSTDARCPVSEPSSHTVG